MPMPEIPADFHYLSYLMIFHTLAVMQTQGRSTFLRPLNVRLRNAFNNLFDNGSVYILSAI